MERQNIEDKRVCVNCDSGKTYIGETKKGTPYLHWYKHNGSLYCEKCNNKLFKNPKYHPLTHNKRFNFKGKSVYLDENPRKGICSLCGSTKRTHIHHIQYHDSDPLKDTMELCISCHTKEGWRLGQIKKKSHL